MFSVLLLAGLEKFINLALATDPITQAGLQPLSGKAMRLIMREPALQFDTIFNEDHVRFEPVTTSLFEPKGGTTLTQPDCVVMVQSPAHLLQLMGDTQGNLPIEGDYKVLMQVKQLLAGFDTDIIGRLQPLIGLPLASQLQQWFGALKQTMAPAVKQATNDFSQLLQSPPCQSQTTQSKAEIDDLKQTLLQLRADIEREQARLDAIKQEQAARLTE